MIDWVERKPTRPSKHRRGDLVFESWEPAPAGAVQASCDMQAWQGGLCAACGSSGTTVLDHDHRTAKVRGYLCPSCNQGESLWNSNPAWDRWRAGSNPATVLGLDEIYVSSWRGAAVPKREISMDEKRAAMQMLAERLGLTTDRTNLPQPTTPTNPTG